MIKIQELYDAVNSQANSEENGLVSPVFNAFLKIAELDVLDWLTGKETDNDQRDNRPSPGAFLTQKNKDWLLPFTVPVDQNFKNGTIDVPGDYYTHQSLRVAWQEESKWNDVDILNANKVANRLNSKVVGIKPTRNKPIAELMSIQHRTPNVLGDKPSFVLYPEKIDGQYKLVYIRYPKFGSYITTEDPIYRNEIMDPSSKNLEWSEALLPFFVWRINQLLNKRNREADAFQMNIQKP